MHDQRALGMGGGQEADDALADFSAAALRGVLQHDAFIHHTPLIPRPRIRTGSTQEIDREVLVVVFGGGKDEQAISTTNLKSEGGKQAHPP